MKFDAKAIENFASDVAAGGLVRGVLQFTSQPSGQVIARIECEIEDRSAEGLLRAVEKFAKMLRDEIARAELITTRGGAGS